MRDEVREALDSKVRSAAEGMGLMWPDRPEGSNGSYLFTATLEAKSETHDKSTHGWYYRGLSIRRSFVFKTSDTEESIRQQLKGAFNVALEEVAAITEETKQQFV